MRQSKNFLFTFCISLSLLSIGSAQAAPGGRAASRVLDETISRYVMTETPTGNEILTRLTGFDGETSINSAYRSFLQRMEWSENTALRDELTSGIKKIKTDFETFRKANGNLENLESMAFSIQEGEFLKNAALSLRTNKLENHLIESMALTEPRGSAYYLKQEAFRRGEVVPGITKEISALEPAALEAAKLSWMRQVGIRFRSYSGFFNVFKLSEGEWKSFFVFNGKAFTPHDLAVIRKYNRLLDGLNEYARMRLVIRSFANERPQIYTNLNEATTELTGKYLEGTIDLEHYLIARKTAGRNLHLNDVTWEAERRMLTTVERTKILGGGRTGGTHEKGLIEISETNIKNYQDKINTLKAALEKNSGDLLLLDTEIKMAHSPESRAQFQEQKEVVQREMLRDNANLLLWQKRLDAEVRKIEPMYAEFVENYDTLELFINLRQGKINSETVRAFDLPQPFIPNRAELKDWDQLFERALYNSTNALVLKEKQLFFKTRVGSTRAFIREMNEITGKYFGKRFTETAIGQDFANYNRHVALTILTRLGKLIGIAVPTGIAIEYADKLWTYVWGEDR